MRVVLSSQKTHIYYLFLSDKQSWNSVTENNDAFFIISDDAESDSPGVEQLD